MVQREDLNPCLLVMLPKKGCRTYSGLSLMVPSLARRRNKRPFCTSCGGKRNGSYRRSALGNSNTSHDALYRVQWTRHKNKSSQ